MCLKRRVVTTLSTITGTEAMFLKKGVITALSTITGIETLRPKKQGQVQNILEIEVRRITIDIEVLKRSSRFTGNKVPAVPQQSTTGESLKYLEGITANPIKDHLKDHGQSIGKRLLER